MPTENTIAQLISEKKSLARLVLVAVLLAVSIGITSSLVAAKLPFSAVWIFLAIAFGCLLALARGLVNRMSFDDEFEAVVFFQPSTKRLIEVRGYEFSREISRTLQAVETENRSIFSDWIKEPLAPERHAHPDTAEGESDKERKEYIAISKVNASDAGVNLKLKSVTLLEEIVQFCILDALSTHLSGHFENRGSKSTQELQRKDIPEVLQANRVLNLLTTPIEQRDIFIEAFPDADKRPAGEIHSVWCSDGAMYSKFDLTLPRGSKVTVLTPQTIRIETSRLVVDLSATYSGMSAVVPRAFESRYARLNPDDLETRYVEIRLKGSVKPLGLLSSKGWDDYTWLDSFREDIRSAWILEEFMQRINWQTIEATLHCQKQRRELPQEHTVIPP